MPHLGIIALQAGAVLYNTYFHIHIYLYIHTNMSIHITFIAYIGTYILREQACTLVHLCDLVLKVSFYHHFAL